jgi:CBS domain-containing protein
MIETAVDTVDVGSPPTVSLETPATDVARELRDPEVPAVPVLDDGTVVGIVTESDVVAMVAETGDRPPVEAIMSTPVSTIAPTATLAEAATVMRIDGVKHLPVVADGTYLGVLSAGTLAPYLSRRSLDIEWEAERTRIDAVDGGERSASD